MKINKNHIKTAIIIYNDPDLKENRRVIFGDPSKIFLLIISEMPIILERIKQITGKDFKNPLEIMSYFMNHKEDWVKLHDVKISENMEMDLTYEVKELKS